MPLSSDFVTTYANKEVPWGWNGMGYIVYKRTYSRELYEGGPTEEWFQTVERCVNGAEGIGAMYTKKELERLYDYVFNLKATFSGRALWQLGTENIDIFGGSSLCNCYFLPMGDLEDFEVLFNYLMLGGGVGFTVERAKVHSLPIPKQGVVITHEHTNDADIIVPDKREGWSNLLHSVLKAYFETGKSFTYSTIIVRPKGAKLGKFGGTASGPEALIDGITDICAILDERAAKRKKLRSIDVLDICNIIGRVVVAGSARRSAQIALGDPDDFLFLRAKNWATGDIPGWRANSNNSVYADSYEEIIDEVWKGYDGSGECYGFVNRNLSRKVGRLLERVNDSDIEGFNPCAEIGLSNYESCNLSTIFLPNITSKAEFIDIAILMYKTQKAITSLPYISDKTTKIVQKNRRLGLSITGILQATDEQRSWCDEVYVKLREFDKEWSEKLGVPASIKLTTVQPSGTLSLLPGVTPGIHPAYARFYVRRVRFGNDDPLVEHCRKAGFPVQFDIGIDGREDYSRYVVSFPCESPEGAMLAKDMTAIEQLDWLRWAQKTWADNAVSVTVYYRKEELHDIQVWLKEHYEDSVKSVSFLLHSDHNFVLPPYEEITEKEYHSMVRSVKMITSDSLGSDVSFSDCAGGSCPVR